MRQRIASAMYPIAHVDIMAVLFDFMVAAQPVEYIPAVCLKKHLCRAFSPTTAISGTTAIPIDPARNNVADSTSMDAFHPFTIPVFIPPLEATAYGQSLFFCDLIRFHASSVSFGINAKRFLDEYMFSLFDGVQIVVGMEAGR